MKIDAKTLLAGYSAKQYIDGRVDSQIAKERGEVKGLEIVESNGILFDLMDFFVYGFYPVLYFYILKWLVALNFTQIDGIVVILTAILTAIPIGIYVYVAHIMNNHNLYVMPTGSWVYGIWRIWQWPWGLVSLIIAFQIIITPITILCEVLF